MTEVEINGEIKCVYCGASLTWPRTCQHFAWFVYGNKCFNCALNNFTPDCTIGIDIKICKRPLKERILTIQSGSLYFVLAPKKY